MNRATPSELILFVPRHGLWLIAFWSVLIGLFSVPVAVRYSPWLPAGVALSIFVATHAVVASRMIPWVPGLTLTAACVQWILAPWAIYAMPEEFVSSPMMVAPIEYFQFAIPATIALGIGIFLPMARLGRRRPRAAGVRIPKTFRQTCQMMVIVGVVTRVFLAPVVPGPLRFVASLIASFALVGVCGLILTKAPSWRRWTTVVVALEAFYNTLDAQYLDLMLVTGFLAVILIYRFQPRTRVIVAGVLIATVGLVTLNAMKQLYRGVIETRQLSREDRPEEAGATLYELLAEPGRIFAPENLAYNLNRLNQGTIVSRVMAWVPQSEPYAEGETIVTAVRTALVPRIIDPNKPLAGGFVNYVRFTGYRLVGGTSINIAISGEMYANFGRIGGIAGVLGYGLVLGWLFSRFIRWARRSPGWWAWVPFVLYSTVSAEMATNEILNAVTKSLVVMFAVALTVPAWTALRRRPQSAAVPRPNGAMRHAAHAPLRPPAT